MADTRCIRGFRFDSDAAYAKAQKEAEAIDYICAKADVSDPNVALKVYLKLIERNSFTTVVGLSFMKDLRDRAVAAGVAQDDALPPVGRALVSGEPADSEPDHETVTADGKPTPEAIQAYDEFFGREREKKLRNTVDSLKDSLRKCRIIIAALAAVIVILFVIVWLRADMNLNQEEIALQDKYAGWAEELAERERAVTAREKALSDIDR